jgi:Mor family transcriptional regulator
MNTQDRKHRDKIITETMRANTDKTKTALKLGKKHHLTRMQIYNIINSSKTK